MSRAAVAKAYGIDRSTVHRWVKRFYANGNEGLRRTKKPGSARPRRLDEKDTEKLLCIISSPATDYGFETNLWTSSRATLALWRKYRIKVSVDTVWRRLREAGLTYQKPERQYMEASEEERAEWRKKTLPKMLATARKHRAIVYFEDETNVSLSAFLGKTWAQKGNPPKVSVTGKRGGIAAMSAITQTGRLVFRLLDKRINTNDIIDFLKQILRHHVRRHVVVVMDQAPPHTSRKTKAFINSQSRLHVFYLPKYSPDWNPDEKVWNHLKHQELKGHQAMNIKEMRPLVRRKLSRMQRNTRQLKGIFFRCCVANLLR